MSLLLSTTLSCGQPENACTCQSKGEKLLLHGTKLVLETTAILRNHVRHTLALQLISRPNQDTARKATRPPLSASSGKFPDSWSTPPIHNHCRSLILRICCFTLRQISKEQDTLFKTVRTISRLALPEPLEIFFPYYLLHNPATACMLLGLLLPALTKFLISPLV